MTTLSTCGRRVELRMSSLLRKSRWFAWIYFYFYNYTVEYILAKAHGCLNCALFCWIDQSTSYSEIDWILVSMFEDSVFLSSLSRRTRGWWVRWTAWWMKWGESCSAHMALSLFVSVLWTARLLGMSVISFCRQIIFYISNVTNKSVYWRTVVKKQDTLWCKYVTQCYSLSNWIITAGQQQ